MTAVMLVTLAQSSGIQFDLSINLGNILTLTGFIGGGVLFVSALRSRVDALSERTIKMEAKIDKMAEIMVTQSRHDERITALQQSQINQGRRLDDTIRRMNTFLDMKSVTRFEEIPEED